MVNKIYKYGLTALFLALSLAAAAFAQNIKVKAFTDASKYKVGDYITYTIEVTRPKEVKVKLPRIKDSLKSIEYISGPVHTSSEDGTRVTDTYKYTLSKYDSGDAVVPQLPVKYKSNGSEAAILTPAAQFTVHTLEVNQQAEIKDIRDPREIPLDWTLILLWVLIILLVLGAAYLFYKKYRSGKGLLPAVPEVVKLPHEIALEKLSLLEQKQLWQQGAVKQYHTEITEIVREYFEKRFSIPALEMTTSELIYALSNSSGASKITGTVSEFLNNADMVKFAKYVPMNAINQEMMRQAYFIVNNASEVQNDK